MKSASPESCKSRAGRLQVPLGDRLDKRLEGYAAAASAAGVGLRARAQESARVLTGAASAIGAGLLLTAGPASAGIVYTPAYTPVPRGYSGSFAPVDLDLNHDGIADFKFSCLSVNSIYNNFHLVVSPAQAGNAILGNIQGVLSGYGGPFTCHVASALPAGHRIGPGSRFGAYLTMFHRGANSHSGPGFNFSCGYWGDVQGRFLGFEFTIQGQKHFGWARLNHTRFHGRATLTGYAYETEADKRIRAGDTGPVADGLVPAMRSAPPTGATLRPPTLGLLALGWRGLDVWRRKQDQ